MDDISGVYYIYAHCKGVHSGGFLRSIDLYVCPNDFPANNAADPTALRGLPIHLRASSLASLYSHYCCSAVVFTTQLSYRSPPSSIVVLWKALYQTEGGTGLYCPLCSVLYIQKYCSGVEGGDGVRCPPPVLSGGSKFNNST